MLGRPPDGVAPASSSSSPSTTTTSRRAAFCGLGCRRCQQAQPRADPRPSHRRRSPTGRIEGIELLDHGIEERIAVGLAIQAARDKERHDIHTRWRMGDEPGRQGALTRPRASLPPRVRVGASAELGPVRQLALAANELIGGDVADLRQVRRPHQLTPLGRDDIRQSAQRPGAARAFPRACQDQTPTAVRRRGRCGGRSADPCLRWGDARPRRQRSGPRPRQAPPTSPPTAKAPPALAGWEEGRPGRRPGCPDGGSPPPARARPPAQNHGTPPAGPRQQGRPGA